MASSKVTLASSKPPAPAPSAKASAAPAPVSARAQQENSKDEARQSRTMDGTLPSSKVVQPAANASSTLNATQNKDLSAPATTRTSAPSNAQDLAKFLPQAPAPKAPTPTPLFIKPKSSPTDSPVASRPSNDHSMDDGDSDLDFDPFSISSPDFAPSSKPNVAPSSASMPPPPARDPLVPVISVSFSSPSSRTQLDPNNNNNDFSFSDDGPSNVSDNAPPPSTNSAPTSRSKKPKRPFNALSFNLCQHTRNQPTNANPAPAANPAPNQNLPPIVPNGSQADLEDLIDVVINIQRCCMILSRLATTVTTDDINQKSVIITGVAPDDVIINPAAFEAYVYYLSKSVWEKASKSNWGFGAVDNRNADDPFEDPNVRYTIYYSCDSNDFPGMRIRAGEAFQLQRNATIVGIEPSKNPKLVGVHFATADDIRAASEEGREGSKIIIPAKPLFDDFPHVLCPVFALAFIKNDDRFVKIHLAGIPPKASEKKLLCLMRSEAEKWGFSKEDVVVMGIQRNKFTGAPTSYGFATVFGSDLARQFVYHPLSAKTATIFFSIARDRKPTANQ